ncbi:hypothetical protein AAFN47_24810 [Hoeflea sp. CAU 1731]
MTWRLLQLTRFSVTEAKFGFFLFLIFSDTYIFIQSNNHSASLVRFSTVTARPAPEPRKSRLSRFDPVVPSLPVCKLQHNLKFTAMAE